MGLATILLIAVLVLFLAFKFFIESISEIADS